MMPLPAAFIDLLTPWLLQFMLIVARLTFVVFLMPGLGEQVITMRARLFFLMALSAAFATSGLVPVPESATFSALLGLLLSEVFVGFCFGLLLRLTIWMLTIAGSIIAQAIGLAQFLGVALEHEAQTLTANMLSMAGATLLLTADFHINAVAGLMRLYGEIPVGGLALLDRGFIIDSSFAAFNYALLLAWPFVAVNLLYNICLGFINKALPQLMVAFVGAPFMVGAGVILFAISVTGLLVVWKERVLQVVGWL